jgi:hypothetical protein
MGMAACEARATSAIDLFCCLAANASISSTRSVWMRPGRITLTVTPSAATSDDSVLLQATSEERNALEMPRFAIGCTTPDEAMVMIRPHRRARIPGRKCPVTRSTEPTMASNSRRHSSIDTADIGFAGGPPTLLIRISRPPNFCSTAALRAEMLSGCVRSAVTASAFPPSAAIARTAFARRAWSRPDRMTEAPSRASARAAASPRPRLDARTSARFPAMLRSTRPASDSRARPRLAGR